MTQKNRLIHWSHLHIHSNTSGSEKESAELFSSSSDTWVGEGLLMAALAKTKPWDMGTTDKVKASITALCDDLMDSATQRPR